MLKGSVGLMVSVIEVIYIRRKSRRKHNAFKMIKHKDNQEIKSQKTQLLRLPSSPHCTKTTKDQSNRKFVAKL